MSERGGAVCDREGCGPVIFRSVSFGFCGIVFQ